MADNIPKSVKDRIKEWEEWTGKINTSNKPLKNTKPAPTPEQIKAWEEEHKHHTLQPSSQEDQHQDGPPPYTKHQEHTLIEPSSSSDQYDPPPPYAKYQTLIHGQGRLPSYEEHSQHTLVQSSNINNQGQYQAPPLPPSYNESTRPDRIHSIIDNLEVLATNDDIIANLKQSRKHDVFREKVQDIIKTYDKQGKQDITSVDIKLKELEKWCEETTKMDNTPIWKNIGNFIKNSLIGNKDKAKFYKDSITNSAKNTEKAIKVIKNSISEPFSYSTPPQPKNTRERSRG